MYASVYILVLSIVVIGIRGQTFTLLPAGEECPATSVGWKKLADAKSCPGNAPYHCVINEHGEFGEVCVKESWVQPGFCPEYNTAAKKINVKRCQPFDGFSCSTQAFQSHQTYSHEICLRKPRPTTTTEAPPVTTTAAVPESSSPVAAIVIVILLLILIVGGFLVWWFYLRKNYNCKIPNPITGGAITICHKDEKEPGDLEEEISLVGSDKNTGETQIETPYEKKIKRSNPNFVETKNYSGIITKLENYDVVLVVGNTGMGKTTTCVGVLEHYRDMLEWKTIQFPSDAIDKVEERTIVLVDVTFGDLSLYSRYDSNIENMMNRLYTSTRECKEFKVLVTSSSSLATSQTNFPILMGCFELNMTYDISDLKNLYEMYTKPKLDVVNETKEKSKERSKSNEIVNNDNSSDKAKDQASNHGEDNDNSENPINSGQKLSDSVGSTKIDDGPPRSSIDLQQSLKSDMRNDTNIVGDRNQTSTEDMCKGNEEDQKSSKDPELGNKLIQEKGEDGETDPSKVEVEMSDDDDGNLEENEKLIQKAEETWTKTNVSEFGLPIVCYLPGGIEWNLPSPGDSDVMDIFDRYVSSLTNSDKGQGRQKYNTLVFIMLNGSTVDEGFIHKKLLSDIDQDLTPERFIVRATQLKEIGILHKRGNSYSFHNDLLLFAVIRSFAQQNIRTFLAYCYLPFSMQFLRPNSTGSRSFRQFEVEVDVDWETLCVFCSRLVKRQREDGNEFKEIELYQIFKEQLNFHEEGTMKFYKIDKTTMDDKKGNAFVRKMVNHYPELKEYYSYAEPDKFRSIPEEALKATVKRHPPCSRNKNDFTKK